MPDPQTPDWVRDAIFDQSAPDRFTRGSQVPRPARLAAWGSPPTPHGFQGGDLLGVLEHLDHTHDDDRVDPRLGGDDALRRLIDGTHSRGIKVVLDGVFNHASRGFFEFHDILENGQDSADLDWFTIHGWPLNADDPEQGPKYSGWWVLHALPKFNTQTPTVREFLREVGRHWIDSGADGWRLDVAHEVKDRSFWAEFRHRVHAVNPETDIAGEVGEKRLYSEKIDIPEELTHWLRGDCWDALTNSLFTRICFADFIDDDIDREADAQTSFRELDPVGAPTFRRHVEELLTHDQSNTTAVMMNLIGSHDRARFLHFARVDRSALRLATLFQLTFDDGDEAGMTDGRDPDYRRAIPRDRPESWDADLVLDFQKMIALRKNHPALRRDSFTFHFAEGDAVALIRQLGAESVVVALNAGKQNRRIDIPANSHLSDGSPRDEVSNHEHLTVKKSFLRQVDLDPGSGKVFASHIHS